jgi:DNA-binding XRE family transcriptional regulator
LTNKQYLIGEAENLFVYKLKTVETIANELNLSRKTVMNWKEKGDWDNKRKLYIKSKIAFHEELFEFARKIMKDITEDMEKGNKIDAGRMYAFCKLVPMFTKVKDYEDIVAKKEEKATPRGLTPELIAQIEEEVLGITHNDNNSEEIEEN